MVYIKDGAIYTGNTIQSHYTKEKFIVNEVGVLNPQMLKTNRLKQGQIGYLIAGMKNIHNIHIGDTLHRYQQCVEVLPGFKRTVPKVYAGFYPVLSRQFDMLKDSIKKLSLNDSSVFIKEDRNDALGSGFHIGFLGALHMDVFRQRLECEFSQNIVVTFPTVLYKGKHL